MSAARWLQAFTLLSRQPRCLPDKLRSVYVSQIARAMKSDYPHAAAEACPQLPQQHDAFEFLNAGCWNSSLPRLRLGPVDCGEFALRCCWQTLVTKQTSSHCFSVCCIQEPEQRQARDRCYFGLIVGSPRSSVPRMIVLPGSCCRTEQSRSDCDRSGRARCRDCRRRHLRVLWRTGSNSFRGAVRHR
jgi:hypothetical protein